ncbi:hypothetical protein [Clostridium estertheticum]|uniref:hypothetical protein n=1 Tax=Clostridium estertheticum TaxID=238834 RepID=UPI001CF31FA7|nr:hypothetical protein [Clostridium estertheticum]MCB2355752.1 hypothetical protein [Clostridium estertheticum]WAG39340.1 hypothetical protein LL065_13605 [Clostridium estertheticum]
MKIYEITGANGFEELQLRNYEQKKYCIDWLESDVSIRDKWNDDIEVDIITKGKKSDCPFIWVGKGVMVISENAKEKLESYWIDDCIELLPIKCKEGVYYLLHVIDVRNISFDFKIEIGNRKVNFNKLECIKNKIDVNGLFRGYYQGDKLDKRIFITERFKDSVKNSTLKGFDFREIWDSEEL